MSKITINNKDVDLSDVDPNTPLLWALRDTLGLVGTKFGCGIAQCGACTILMNGQPIRSCQARIGQIKEAEITTIEGLADNDGNLTPLQQAWIDHDVPQCGYCQAGQIMSAASLLATNAKPTDDDIDTALAGNYCRCGTYVRIRAAVHTAASYYNAAPSAGGAE